jgi:transcriptional regulatory protein RtcR
VEGAFVEVNCATLRGDGAMSALFGHKKGSFTGATADRAGLLRSAHGGVLFLDEIGELGLDEQAMLLRAVEEKRFLPLGSDVEATSAFQLIAGSNRDLIERVGEGQFREDLLARINLWTFCLPALRERTEDIEPNLEYELGQFARRAGRTVRMSTEARERYLRFAMGEEGKWPRNFRDLSASVTRMATLGPAGRITEGVVDTEIGRLRAAWAGGGEGVDARRDVCAVALGAERAKELDRFDRVQLADVLGVCARSRSMSEAGRALFAESRKSKASSNDADRLRKYLGRFGLTWAEVGAQKDGPERG